MSMSSVFRGMFVLPGRLVWVESVEKQGLAKREEPFLPLLVLINLTRNRQLVKFWVLRPL